MDVPVQDDEISKQLCRICNNCGTSRWACCAHPLIQRTLQLKILWSVTFFHMVAVLLTVSMAYATAAIASFLCSADTAIITLASHTGTTLHTTQKEQYTYIVNS